MFCSTFLSSYVFVVIVFGTITIAYSQDEPIKAEPISQINNTDDEISKHRESVKKINDSMDMKSQIKNIELRNERKMEKRHLVIASPTGTELVPEVVVTEQAYRPIRRTVIRHIYYFTTPIITAPYVSYFPSYYYPYYPYYSYIFGCC